MAAITFDATSSGLATSATTLTVAHTISTNADSVLWVYVINSLSGNLVTGITYNSVAMVYVSAVQNSGGRWNCLYKLIAPTTGTNNIVVTLSSADRIEMYAASYYNVRQSPLPENWALNNPASTTSITPIITTFSNQCWLITGFNPSAGGGSAGTGAFSRIVASGGYGIYDTNAAFPKGNPSMTINCNSGPASAITAVMEPSPVLTDGIVAYYKLDGNSNDYSGYGSTGTDTAITYSNANGKLVQGAGFNGTTSNITTSSGFLTLQFALTLSCWIKPSALPTSGNFMSLLARFTNSAGTFGYDLRLQNTSGVNQINWHITQGNGTNVEAIYNTTLTLGTWVHLVAMNDGVNSSILYLNGVQVATASGANNSTATNNFYIGAINYNAGVTRYLSGDIDEVGAWERPLYPSEVTELYNNGVGMQYPFNQGAPFLLKLI